MMIATEVDERVLDNWQLIVVARAQTYERGRRQTSTRECNLCIISTVFASPKIEQVIKCKSDHYIDKHSINHSNVTINLKSRILLKNDNSRHFTSTNTFKQPESVVIIDILFSNLIFHPTCFLSLSLSLEHPLPQYVPSFFFNTQNLCFFDFFSILFSSSLTHSRARYFILFFSIVDRCSSSQK